MKFTYKKVKVYLPHCPKCGEKLSGNGSLALPYHCICGTWKVNWQTGEYDIVPDKDVSEYIKEQRGI